MSLIDRLRFASQQLPPSHTIDLAHAGQVLGALVQLVEHGDDFLDAADLEGGILAFLTAHAESENERIAGELADQAAQAPQTGAILQAPAVPIGAMPAQPAQPVAAPVPPAVMPGTFTDPQRFGGQVPQPAVAPGAQPGMGDQTQQLLGALLGELQSMRAERGSAQRATVSTPDFHPSEPEQPAAAGSEIDGGPREAGAAPDQPAPAAPPHPIPPGPPFDQAPDREGDDR